jgi:hypothetical protein
MKRRISPLTGNVAADGLLTGIANRTTKVPITPKGSFFPEFPLEITFIHLPEPKGGLLF